MNIGRLVVLTAIVVVASGCVFVSEPGVQQMSDEVQRLERAFPVLEELRVAGFREQDWCQFLDYPRGAFSNESDATSTCNLFDRQPMKFDEAAQADFERVAGALRDTGVDAYLVWWIEYDDRGRLRSAEFDTGGSSYIYDPRGTWPKENIEGESEFTRINDSWWYWWEDWN
jgi:hypothetical protein